MLRPARPRDVDRCHRPRTGHDRPAHPGVHRFDDFVIYHGMGHPYASGARRARSDRTDSLALRLGTEIRNR